MKQEAVKKLRLFENFTDILIKNGYSHNFFITDLFNRDIVRTGRLVYAARIKKYWKDYLRPKGSVPVNVYIAMPYCMRRCSYCIYFKMKANHPGEIEEYKNNLISFINYFASTLKSMNIENVYFGGGTPSLFSESQLQEICVAVKKKHTDEKSS